MAALSRTGITQADIIKMMQGFNEEDNELYWAKNSQFYKQVMSDGNIFNPYLHRRFLPVQFKNMLSGFMTNVWPGNRSSVNDCYQLLYQSGQTGRIVKTMMKEVELLAYLRNKDALAYDERSMLSPFKDCQEGFSEFLDFIKGNCKSRYLYDESTFWPIVDEIRGAVESAKNYQELSDAVNTVREFKYSWWAIYHIDCFTLINFVYINNNIAQGQMLTAGARKLCELFLKSGAYYTLKHTYMFDDGIINRASSVKQLYDMAQNASWVGLTNTYCDIAGLNFVIEPDSNRVKAN